MIENEFAGYEFLAEEILEKYHLMGYQTAILKIHFPETEEEMQKARRRLAFNEFFLFLMALHRFKEEEGVALNEYPVDDFKRTDAFLESLPYELTGAQKKVIAQIRNDFFRETSDEPPDSGGCRFRENHSGSDRTPGYCISGISGSIDGTDGGTGSAAL